MASKAGEEMVDTAFGQGKIRRNMGRSIIISPRGAMIATGSPDKWEVVMATVELGEIRAARKDLSFGGTGDHCNTGD